MLKALKEFKVHKDLRVLKVELRVHKGQQVHRDHKVAKVHKEDQQVLKVFKDLRVL